MQDPFRVVLTQGAWENLYSIWLYNERRYGQARADEYYSFLLTSLRSLDLNYRWGSAVEGSPGLHSMTFKKSTRGDGHIAIYEVGEVVYVLRIFHTKMDIRSRLEQDEDTSARD